MNKAILRKYLNGACSSEEFEEFAKWVNEASLSDKTEKMVLEDWNNFESGKSIATKNKYKHLLDRIHHEINLKEYRIEKDTTTPLMNITKWFGRVAAILFLPLVTVVLYMLSHNNIQSELTAEAAVDTIEVVAPIGSRTVVQLQEGTKIHLNYGSKIKYPREFIGKTREIKLIGEGYFDVSYNPEKPFIVDAGNLHIKVLGTSFNVHAYPDDNIIATTLVNGKVSLEEVKPDGKLKIIGSMIPDQHVSFHIDSRETSSSVGNINKYIAWKDGKLVFDNEPITNVAMKLSRMFDVDILVAEDAKDLTYTVTLADESLIFILDLMKEITPIKYTVFKRKKLSGGTYSKQQIKIERRE
ncbi:MAG: FecR family protein [Draconibacterium sp.]